MIDRIIRSCSSQLVLTNLPILSSRLLFVVTSSNCGWNDFICCSNNLSIFSNLFIRAILFSFRAIFFSVNPSWTFFEDRVPFLDTTEMAIILHYGRILSNRHFQPMNSARGYSCWNILSEFSLVQAFGMFLELFFRKGFSQKTLVVVLNSKLHRK
jgi:hypothetical protein